MKCIKCAIKRSKDCGVQTDTSRPEKAFLPLKTKTSSDGEACILDESGRFYLYYIRDPEIYQQIVKGDHLYSPLLIQHYLQDHPEMIPMLSNLLEPNTFWYTAQFDETFSNGVKTTKRKVFVFYWSSESLHTRVGDDKM